MSRSFAGFAECGHTAAEVEATLEMSQADSANLKRFAPLRVIAAFDIGSNSLKMTIARQTPAGEIEELVRSAVV